MLEAFKKTLLAAAVASSGVAASIESYTYEATYTGSEAATEVTYSSCDIGTADADRWVVITINSAGGGSSSVSSVTIGGVSATITRTAYDSHEQEYAAIAYAKVPTGATADIVVTYSSTTPNRIGVFTIVLSSGATLAEYAGYVDTNGDLSTTIDIAENGVVIAAYCTGKQTANHTWTNMTERYDEEISASRCTAASYQATSAEIGRSISCSNGSSDSASALSSFYAT